MLSFKEYITEELIEISREDINKLYAPISKAIKEISQVLKQDPKTWKAANLEEIISKYQNYYDPVKIFKSSELKSESTKKANSLKPIQIKIHLFVPYGSGNLYNPKKNEIIIGVPNPIRAIIREPNMHTHLIDDIRTEFSDIRIKSAIRHELTHWIDDSIHNNHIANTISNPNYIKRITQAISKNQDPRYLEHIEVTAMVNQIAEIKRRVGEIKYDKLTWIQLVSMVPGLRVLNNELGAKWREVMFSRLARENLIGKSFTLKLR